MATENITEQLANASLQEPEALHQDDQAYDESNYLNLRSLVSTREAGIIIGKGGANVAAIRDATGVKAGVSKAIPGVQDRVLSVGGSAEELSKAYSMIAQNLVDNTTADPAAPANNGSTPTTVRLLVAHAVMGSIIGKQGAKIKQIQDSTSVRMVASKDLLPQSTERVVEITGAPSSIGEAVLQISQCLVEESERGVNTILFHPASVSGGAPPTGSGSGMGYNPSHPGGYGGLSALSSGNGYSRGGRGGRGYRSASAPRGGNYNGQQGQSRRPSGQQQQQQQQQNASVDDADLKTQNISFPADMIGCIIGRGGSKISEIRKQSGSRINISKEPNPENGERLFSIIGTTESNERALFLLYSSLEKEKERRDKEQGEQQEQTPVLTR